MAGIIVGQRFCINITLWKNTNKRQNGIFRFIYK